MFAHGCLREIAFTSSFEIILGRSRVKPKLRKVGLTNLESCEVQKHRGMLASQQKEAKKLMQTLGIVLFSLVFGNKFKPVC